MDDGSGRLGRSSWIRPLPRPGPATVWFVLPEGAIERTGEARSDPRSAAGPVGRAARFDPARPPIRELAGRDHIKARRSQRRNRSWRFLRAFSRVRHTRAAGPPRTRAARPTMRRRSSVDEPERRRLPRHRRGRRRDPARQPQQVRVGREGRRLPPRSRPRVGGPLQLRLRLHRRDALRRRRPHRRAAPDRRADVPRLPRLGAGRSAGSRCATRRATTSRSCASPSATRTRPTSSSSTRSGRTGSSRSSTSSRRTSCSRRRTTDVLGWRDAARAHEVLAADHKTYLKERRKA